MRTLIAALLSAVLTWGCSGSGGESVDGGGLPIPAVSLTAQPTEIQTGSATNLVWSANDATACTASGAWSGSKPLSGSEASATLTATSDFTLTCAGPGGSSSRTVAVSVKPTVPDPAPALTFTAAPATLTSGQATTLTWASTNATACVASGAWSGDRGPAGSISTGPLTSSSAYTLSCTGSGGSTSQTVNVTVVAAPPPAPTLTLSVDPATIVAGQQSNLAWTTTNATACTASGGWSGTRPVNGTASTGALAASTAFTLSCVGTGGEISQTVTVAVGVPPPPQPSVSLSASPATVVSGSASTLTWNSANATSCVASGGWSGSKPLSGSASTGALTGGTAYTLTCSGPGGSASQTVPVNVTPPPPEVTLGASPASVTSGQSATLSWFASSAKSCTASGGWSGARATSGTASTGPITSSTVFTLTCTGDGGTRAESVTVSVGQQPAPDVTISATPSSLASGASTTLTWTSTNATSCTASGGWSGSKATSGSQSSGPLTATTAFTLNCTGPGGSGVATTSVVVTPPAPTVTLAADPLSIASGQSSTLTWSSTDATSCSASGGWSGAKSASGTQSSGALASTTTFSLSCTGPGGSASKSVTVTVTTPAPTITLTANPATVTSGQTSTLTWSTTNATSCTASDAWSGAKATNGSAATPALNATSDFTLTCTGPGGTSSRTVTVTVTSPVPSVTLSAAPASIANGESSTLTWSSTNATGCTASGGWSGARATSGSQSTGALGATTTFSLACTGAGGTGNQSVTVTVAASSAPTVTLTASPATVASGGSATLTWSSTNATSCTALGGWTGTKATSGSQSTGALSVMTTFTLSCSGPGGSASQSTTVSIAAPAPTITLTATPPTVVIGNASTLTWNTTNATSCTASGGWSGTKSTSGSQSTGALNTATTFTLSCTGPGGSSSQSVSVAAVEPPPAVTLSATPTAIVTGNSSTLNWTATNSTSCTASGGWTGSKATSGTQSTGALNSTTTFTLTCSGPGGSASDSVTVTVGATGAAFPLHVEGGKRYLVDANGQPFFMHGDTPWSLVVQLTRAQVDQYLDDRSQKGFNTILLNLIEHYFAASPPLNAYGAPPFTTPGDYSTPNDAYFAHAEYVVSAAAQRGILVLMTPTYMGYNGGSEGWYAEMVANGEAKLRTYGQYVGNRFKAHPNVLWVQGGDYNPPEKTLLRAVANGIRDVDPARLQTFHGGPGTSALGFLGASEPWLTVNNFYTYRSPETVVSFAFQEYARSTMPFFFIEGWYEGEGANEALVRTQAYHAVLSGAAGHLMGNNPIWLFGSGWQTALNSAGARTLTHLRSLFDSLAWWTLAPDTGNTLLTAGAGTGASRAVAARAANGAFALLYTPSVRGLTVNLAQLSGPNVRARWYDPSRGTYTTVAGSPFAASGSQTFTPAGNNGNGFGDWVLVLESTP